MIELWLEGGFSMFFVLALGIAALVASAMFARRPDPRKVESVRALAASLLFASLMGLATNLSAVFHKVPARPEWAHSPDLNLIVMSGLGESLAPFILGFACLTIHWLLVAYGFRRLARSM